MGTTTTTATKRIITTGLRARTGTLGRGILTIMGTMTAGEGRPTTTKGITPPSMGTTSTKIQARITIPLQIGITIVEMMVGIIITSHGRIRTRGRRITILGGMEIAMVVALGVEAGMVIIARVTGIMVEVGNLGVAMITRVAQDGEGIMITTVALITGTMVGMVVTVGGMIIALVAVLIITLIRMVVVLAGEEEEGVEEEIISSMRTEVQDTKRKIMIQTIIAKEVEEEAGGEVEEEVGVEEGEGIITSITSQTATTKIMATTVTPEEEEGEEASTPILMTTGSTEATNLIPPSSVLQPHLTPTGNKKQLKFH